MTSWEFNTISYRYNTIIELFKYTNSTVIFILLVSISGNDRLEVSTKSLSRSLAPSVEKSSVLKTVLCVIFKWCTSKIAHSPVTPVQGVLKQKLTFMLITLLSTQKYFQKTNQCPQEVLQTVDSENLTLQSRKHFSTAQFIIEIPNSPTNTCCKSVFSIPSNKTLGTYS